MLIPVEKKVIPRYESGVNEMGLVYAEIVLISVDDQVLHRRGFLDEHPARHQDVRGEGLLARCRHAVGLLPKQHGHPGRQAETQPQFAVGKTGCQSGG